jgi:hypothetical protein
MSRLTVAAAALALAAAWSCTSTLPDQDRRIVSTAPDAKLSVDMLWKDFQANAADASRRYHGRAIVLSGTVTTIATDAASPTILFAQAGDRGVLARLLDDQSAAIVKSATPGQRLTLKCFCEGLDGNVILKSCVKP